MFSKSLAVGVLAIGCVAAAAGGAYVAVRQNADAPSVAATSANAATQPVDAPRAVAETEAIVSSSAAAPPKPGAAVHTGVSTETVVVPPPPAPATAVRESREVREKPPVREKPAARPLRRSPATSQPAAPTVSARAEQAPREIPPATPPRDAREVVVEATPPPVEPPPPAAPQFEQLVLPASSVIGLRVETPISTERARIEDRVDARVTRDVIADGRVAIPAGAQAVGSVILVERGGKVKERARLGVRFHTLVLADGSEVPISTEAIYREGESPSGDSTRKIGGAAVGGAILGAIIGGKKGAMIGGATGAAGGTAVVMAGDRNAATLPTGTVVTIRLAAPVGVEVEKR
jgi:hypothetical protein